MKRILFVDDEPSILDGMGRGAEPGMAAHGISGPSFRRSSLNENAAQIKTAINSR